jgi:hypothetical protein
MVMKKTLLPSMSGSMTSNLLYVRESKTSVSWLCYRDSVAASCLLLLTGVHPKPAFSQEQSSLPPGYYIYLGSRPGKLLPKAFTITGQGSVVWQDDGQSASAVQTTSGQTTSTRSDAPKEEGSQTDTQTQWDSYNYPLIKWKAHPITTIPGGVAQLDTTFESFRSYIKYRLRLFKIATIPYSVHVQLLDSNGFNLHEFEVYSYSFHPIPGTSLVEAADETYCMEKDYRRARDYSIR